MKAALGLTALAFAAGCGGGQKAEQTVAPTATSTPYFTATPEATSTPVATATPERTYIPPSVDIPEAQRHYLGSVVNLEDVIILCNGTSDGYSGPQYLMKKGARVRAPASGTIVGIYGDATTIFKGIEIQYAPKGLVKVVWMGSFEEFVAGSSISEGTPLGSIEEGLFNNLNPDANLIIRHRTAPIANAYTNIYVDNSGTLFIQ